MKKGFLQNIFLILIIGLYTTTSFANDDDAELKDPAFILDHHKAWADTVDPDYQRPATDAYEAWRDKKFGMRIHWGIYSVIGVDASWSLANSHPEFQKVYRTLYEVFNPTEFNAVEWAKLAKQSGFTYFVFTSKHCDGFCMYPTKTKVNALRRKKGIRSIFGLGEVEDCFINFSIMDTRFKRDIVGELVKEFRKQGFGIGLYYSNWDWNDYNFRWNEYNVYYDPNYSKETHPEQWQAFIDRQRAQVREICSNYGPIQQIAFDCGWPKEAWRDLVEIVKTARRLQPNCLFRHRGLGPYGDYQTPENFTPIGPDDPRLKKPWQAIVELGTDWAYTPSSIYKPKEWILETLIDTTSMGGNFMVGVSPMPNGRFPPETVERLLWAGKWLKVNGGAIYKTRPLTLSKKMNPDDPLNPWGPDRENGIRFTRSKDWEYIYAIMKNWPGESATIRSVRAKKNSKIIMLGYKNSGGEVSLKWKQDGSKLIVEIPKELQKEDNRPCEFAWVLKIKSDLPVQDRIGEENEE